MPAPVPDRRARRRTTRPRTCPRCAELLDPDLIRCRNCGRVVSDPAAQMERRIFTAILLMLVLGAVWLAGMPVVSFIHDHLSTGR